MKRLLPAAAVFGLLIATGPTTWARKWTSSGGQFSIEAELVEYADGAVTLKKPDGETISVPLARLSTTDRRFVAATRKKPKAEPKAVAKAVAAPDPSYVSDVRPFLTTYCAECHNPKRAKAGYTVDTFAALTENGKKGPLVVAGKPDESLLVRLLQPGRKHMPPNDSTQPMPPEISKVTAWIAAGAVDDTAGPVQPKGRAEKKKPRR